MNERIAQLEALLRRVLEWTPALPAESGLLDEIAAALPDGKKPPHSETPDALDTWAIKADNDRLRAALNSALKVLQGVLGSAFKVEPLPQDQLTDTLKAGEQP